MTFLLVLLAAQNYCHEKTTVVHNQVLFSNYKSCVSEKYICMMDKNDSKKVDCLK